MKYLALAIALAGCSPAAQLTPADGAAPQSDLAGGNYYLPAGFTLTPFLSTDAQHSFTAAGQATQPNKDYQAVLETDAGRIVIDLLETDTPITVNSFVWLALHHFFDGTAFHRVIDGFVAQGGDPNTLDADTSTWGIGGPGYTFGLEIVASLHYDAAGVVGMARTSDPNTNGSQFFITLAAAPNLDGMYTIFAKVSEGLTVLPNIARGMPPATPTRMQRVYIVEKP
ncbi:MAG TPA: peptidylprolyl isomerase [Polyangia bacterium]|nr:peptidylprolyl isomerase [Polyangia bacterium]